MVVSNPLGPGKFYGTSLPRPYIYTDIKHSSERVNPPVPLFDPLLTWAKDAHWSMGGLSFTRLRLQGRIEGSVKRLRAQKEKQADNCTPTEKCDLKESPMAPVVGKRKRFLKLIDDEEEDEEVQEEQFGGKVEKKRLARRLREDFDRVADKSPVKVEAKKRLRKVGERVVETGLSSSGIRVSSRLAKKGLSAA